MKVWLVEIFVCNTDDEYGNISFYFIKNKLFDKKEKAHKYLRDFRKVMETNNSYNRTWENDYVDVYYNQMGYRDKSKITEIELEI